MKRWIRSFITAYVILFSWQFIKYGIPDRAFHDVFDVIIYPAILSAAIVLGFYLNDRGVTISGLLGRDSEDNSSSEND